MKERMKQLFTGEAAVAVADQPVVQDARRAFDETRTTYQAAKAQLDAIEVRLAPSRSSSSEQGSHVDELQLLRARRELRPAQELCWETGALLKAAEHALHAVLETERQAMTAARLGPRRALVRDLFDKLDEAKGLAEHIERFDEETRTLGGVPPAHPFGELLDEPCRPSMVSYRREHLVREGSL